MNLNTFFDTCFTKLNAMVNSGDVSVTTANHISTQLIALKNSAESIQEHGITLPTANDFLDAGKSHMQSRSVEYDKPSGERSMGKTVAMFNICCDQKLTEEQGWLFMGILKKVRSQQGSYKADNYEDAASYAGLQGEAAALERSNIFTFNPHIKETKHEHATENFENTNRLHDEQLAG